MNFLPYIQIISGILLGILILVQRSEASLGSAFGGDSFGGNHRTRRGPELIIFRTTIILAIIFVASALISIVYR